MTTIKKEFKEGDPVFCYDIDGSKHNGTIYKNAEYPEVSEWYIKYYNGEEYAVLNLNGVYYG